MAIKEPSHRLYKITCLAIDEQGRPLHIKKRQIIASPRDAIKPAAVNMNTLYDVFNESDDSQVYFPNREEDEIVTKDFYLLTTHTPQQIRTQLDRHCEIETEHAIAIELMSAYGGRIQIG